MKATTPLLGTLLLSASLGSLAFTAQQAEARTLQMGIGGELASFDTSQVSGGVWESQVLMDVFEGLVQKDPKGNLVPGMASDWVVSKDGKTWTFRIRSNAKWSDGTPVTADDFVFGWQHLLNPDNASKYAYMLYPVKNAKAINLGKQAPDTLGVKSLDDGNTFQVTLNEPVPYFEELMTHYTAYPLPKHVVEKYGKDWVKMSNIVTNGAFTPTNWVSQSSITTVKNRYYYDAKKVALDGVVYNNIENLNAMVARYRGGQLDIAHSHGFPVSQLKSLKRTMPKDTHTAPWLGNEYYVLNQRKGEPTADPRVRKALSLAIRRDILAEKIAQGAFNATNAFVPAGIHGYQPQANDELSKPYDERLKEAKALMKEAGYSPEHPLHLHLRFNSDDWNRSNAVAISSMWQPLGVTTELDNAEATVHYQAIARGDFDAARAGWVADYNDPQNFLTLMETGVGNNYGAYSNSAYDKLMHQAATTMDPGKRYQILEQAEKLAMNDYAVIPLLTQVSRNLVNPDIKGWEDNISDDHPSHWISFTK
ncbi:peptide ABC transporter substrate-binding protein [Carnimonas bestiolae]|uniref:peptide ABC transporter substrate-binding protein n=1 Tax=Carnimonas bestiolae TaxID=3402172 RepID=UPI003EDBAD2D